MTIQQFGFFCNRENDSLPLSAREGREKQRFGQNVQIYNMCYKKYPIKSPVFLTFPE